MGPLGQPHFEEASKPYRPMLAPGLVTWLRAAEHTPLRRPGSPRDGTRIAVKGLQSPSRPVAVQHCRPAAPLFGGGQSKRSAVALQSMAQAEGAT